MNMKEEIYCKECKKTFKTKAGLKSHMRTHSIKFKLKKVGLTIENVVLIIFIILLALAGITNFPTLVFLCYILFAIIAVAFIYKPVKEQLEKNDKFFISIFAIAGTIASLYFGVISLQYQEADFYPTNAYCPRILIKDSNDDKYDYFHLNDQNFMNLGVFPGGISACTTVENGNCNTKEEQRCCTPPLMKQKESRLWPHYNFIIDKQSNNFRFTESITITTKSNHKGITKTTRVCNCTKNSVGNFECKTEPLPLFNN